MKLGPIFVQNSYPFNNLPHCSLLPVRESIGTIIWNRYPRWLTGNYQRYFCISGVSRWVRRENTGFAMRRFWVGSSVRQKSVRDLDFQLASISVNPKKLMAFCVVCWSNSLVSNRSSLAKKADIKGRKLGSFLEERNESGKLRCFCSRALRFGARKGASVSINILFKGISETTLRSVCPLVGSVIHPVIPI